MHTMHTININSALILDGRKAGRCAGHAGAQCAQVRRLHVGAGWAGLGLGLGLGVALMGPVVGQVGETEMGRGGGAGGGGGGVG